MTASISAPPRVSRTRFWSPRGKRVDLADRGYLPDPEETYGRMVNPELRRFEEIAHVPALILLGEPGSGKTSTLKPILSTSASEGPPSSRSLWFDLNAYGDEGRLARNLFEDNSVIAEWKASGDTLTLTLDSFDECIIRIDTLASMLAEELRKLPRDRLLLRIISRTAMWPTSLEHALAELWPQVEAFELTPLRRSDVLAEADRLGADSATFMQRADEQSAQPLAVNPVSLRFLLRSFIQTRSLPADRAALFEDGALALCQKSRRETLGKGIPPWSMNS